MNSGRIEKLEVRLPFNADGSPKPVLLVGTNGAGKTGVMSTLADAMIEIAANTFQNVLPSSGMGHQFFRILGGKTQRVSSNFEFSAAKLFHGSQEFFYRAKSGSVLPSDIVQELLPFGPVASWSGNTPDKVVLPQQIQEQVRNIFMSGVYAFFPSTRFEMPHWANISILDRDPLSDFSATFSNTLRNQPVVQSSI